jgi:ergothioneine biosynthesis protein EgtC
MCRLLGYLGCPIPLDQLLIQPEHSLLVQSYQPLEMTAGLLNADGFGIGWYHPQKTSEIFTYRSTQPIWNDVNLPGLSRYIESGCILANVRSATPGQAVDLSNCQPFTYQHLSGIHNGFIQDFRQTLYRPMRQILDDEGYQSIRGSTDSEHIFALLIHLWRGVAAQNLVTALHKTLLTLAELAQAYATDVSANVMVSDGQQLVASRFTTRSPAPSLYWLQRDRTVQQSVTIASEPLFSDDWQAFPESSIIEVQSHQPVQLHRVG